MCSIESVNESIGFQWAVILFSQFLNVQDEGFRSIPAIDQHRLRREVFLLDQ